MDVQFMMLMNYPLEILVMAVIAMVATEIVKFPLKRIAPKTNTMGWLWILLSVAFSVGVYCIYYYLIRQPYVDVEAGTRLFDWGSMLSLISAEQAVFNFVWDKGIKALIKLIFCKVTGKSSMEADKLLDSTGIGDALDKANDALKEASKTVEQAKTTVQKSSMSVDGKAINSSNTRPKI